MKCFIGCILTMGIVKLPNLNMYWDRNTRLFNIPGIYDLFTKTRFRDIFANVCLRDPTLPSSPDDPLQKIYPMVISIISNSQYYYRPKQCLSIDESMIPFTGRSKMIQYIPSKPCKFGLKAYVLADSDTAYVVNWHLYTGKKSHSQTEPGVISRIVMSLVDGIEGEGYIVYTDRHYSSLKLFEELKGMNIGACGTIMSNRLRLSDNASSEISKMKPHEIKHLTTSSLLLSVWRDHKLVYMLSNFHKPGEVTKDRRMKKKEIQDDSSGRITESVTMPISVFDYNLNMGGVDTWDQISSYYVPDIKSRRWYVKVFYHLIEIAISNSYVIYHQILQKANKTPLTRLGYRQAIIRELVKDQREQKNTPSTDQKPNPFSTTTIRKEKKEIEAPSAENIAIRLDFGGHKNTKKKANLKGASTSSLAKTRSSTKKRKATSPMIMNLDQDCALESIPQSTSKKDTREVCQICKLKRDALKEEIKGLKKQIEESRDTRQKSKDIERIVAQKEEELKKPHQTRLWCQTHKVPVCTFPCYDMHRQLQCKNTRNYKKVRKTPCT